MDFKLIFEGKATLEDLYDLYDKRGFVCIAEDGKITHVIEKGDQYDFH